MERMTFDPKIHQYQLDGQILSSVTQVIEPLMGGFGAVPKDVLEEARLRGTLVHSITAHEDEGKLTADDELLIKTAFLAPYLDAWRAFKREAQPVFEEIEKRIVHLGRRYSGTIDRVCWLNDQRTILEIKTGDHYKEYELQTAGYQQAWNEDALAGWSAETRAAVLLLPSGRYNLHLHRNRLDVQAFNAALTLKNWRLSK